MLNGKTVDDFSWEKVYGKKIRIIELRNKIEADLVSEILQKENIPFYIKTIGEAAYDGIYEIQKGWGNIEAPEKYGKRIIKIVNDFRENKILDIDESADEVIEEKNEDIPERNVYKSLFFLSIFVFIIFSAIVFIIGNSKIQKQKYEIDQLKIGSRFFQYSVLGDKTTIIAKWKNTDTLAAKYYDNNKDGYIEIIQSYNKKGRIVSESFDNNKNGIYEKFQNYNKHEVLDAIFFDKDEDGVTDKSQVILPNETIDSDYKDENNDGFFDKIISRYKMINDNYFSCFNDNYNSRFQSVNNYISGYSAPFCQHTFTNSLRCIPSCSYAAYLISSFEENDSYITSGVR